METSLLKSLIHIQQNLNAPKDQFNAFGKYNYRSLESILAALKPLLAEQSCGIRFEDEVVEHCARTFVKTTLYFFNDKGEVLTTSAEAEHAASKVGFDQSQLTGSTCSYARKYCVSALFLLDDNKDADTNEFHNQNSTAATTPKRATRKAVTTPQQTDKYAGIRMAISSTHSTDELLDLYNSHKVVVDSDPNIRALFTQRKNELMSQSKVA